MAIEEGSSEKLAWEGGRERWSEVGVREMDGDRDREREREKTRLFNNGSIAEDPNCSGY